MVYGRRKGDCEYLVRLRSQAKPDLAAGIYEIEGQLDNAFVIKGVRDYPLQRLVRYAAEII